MGMKTHSRNPDGGAVHHLAPPASVERAARHGSFALHPTDAIVAGAPVELELRFTCGAEALGPSDSLGLAWRLPCDWGHLQAHAPSAPNFVRVRAPEGVRLHLEYQDRGGVKPWHHLFMATVTAGRLDPGSEVVFILGDRSSGSIGWLSQRAAVRTHRFQGLMRAAGASTWLELPGLPEIEIVGGSPASLRGTAPSDCRVGEPVELIVRLMDRFGNVSRGGPDSVALEAPGLRVHSIARVQGASAPLDLWRANVAFDVPGRFRIGIRSPSLGLEAECNPIDCTDTGDAPQGMLYWGDMHAGQSDMGCGQGSMTDFFWYARHVAGLQFASHQPNDVYVTRQDWLDARAQTEEVHADGAFVAFHGCEWTALPGRGGDRNVFYLHDQPKLHRAGRWHSEDDPDPWPDAEDPSQLYEHLAGTDALINLHAGGFTSEMSWLDERLEGLVEIHSTHGTSSWLVERALEQGRTFGVSAGTDGIAGRPGACLPGARRTRNLPNGCFGVYARGLTREDLWEGMRSRRCYGTDGERIRLAVRMGDAFMGDELQAKTLPPVEVDVAGTAAIERVIVRRGSRVIATRELWTANQDHSARYRLTWAGTKSHGSFHAQALEWSGDVRAAHGSLDLVSAVGYYGEQDALTEEEGAISWRSVTAGNIVGFVFDASPQEGERLIVKSNLVDLEAELPLTSDVQCAVTPASGSGRLVLSRAPDPGGSRDCSVTIDLEESPRSGGPRAYWVEVIQVDGSRAWSSPIFVTSP